MGSTRSLLGLGLRVRPALLLLGLIAFAGAGSVRADEPKPKQAEPAPTASQLGELLKRLEKIEAELKELRGGPGDKPAAPAGPVSVVLESMHLGHTYYGGPNGSRFFVAKLILVNPTAARVQVPTKQIVLAVDGADMTPQAGSGPVRGQSFQIAGQTHDLNRIKMQPELAAPPGGTGSTWVVYTGIPAGLQIPALALRVPVAPQPVAIDVNALAKRQLGLKVDRIGPRYCLALLTISGELNSVSVGSLVAELDALVAAKTVRAVIRWSEGAPPLDGQMLSWVSRSLNTSPQNENNLAFGPMLPATLRELHISRLPGRTNAEQQARNNAKSRFHTNDFDAVSAALKSAFEGLPRNELLKEIQSGDPLARLAALSEGGGRLSADDLPLIAKYADDNDPRMQLAALTALRHFGEPAAIDKLIAYARKNVEPAASAAIESLAASRYAAAHEALLGLLKNEQPASRKLIVRILAKYPRPVWSDTIYGFLATSEPDVAIEALRTLVEIGHPKLTEVLSESLHRGSAAMRDEAFQILARRSDRASEELAMTYTLEAIKTAQPTPAMFQLLARTKDARAIPLLLAQLDKPNNSQSQLLSTLATIGDQSAAAAIVKKYPELPDRLKKSALDALQQLKSPEYRRLAGEALTRGEPALVSSAVSGLTIDGSPEAIRMLADALDKSNNPTVWSYVINALGNFGTPEAKLALHKARDDKNETKRKFAINALQSMRRLSPAYPPWLQARQSAENERWDEAIGRYAAAIEADKDFPDAYSGRGHAYLQVKKVAEARKDYARAVELDPYSSEAVTGLGICLALSGEVEQAVKLVEQSRTRMNDDALFAYNTGCVYGRAHQFALKQPKTSEIAAKADGYRKQALLDLKRSIKLGFPDLDWMKKDPDLETLRDAAEFKQLVTPKPEEQGQGAIGRPRGGLRQVNANGGGGGDLLGEELKTDLLFENARP